jgi:hypothetical protein
MKNGPTCHQTRFLDALARISAIYKYAVLHVLQIGNRAEGRFSFSSEFLRGGKKSLKAEG